jgi:hypothetical protein
MRTKVLNNELEEVFRGCTASVTGTPRSQRNSEEHEELHA